MSKEDTLIDYYNLLGEPKRAHKKVKELKQELECANDSVKSLHKILKTRDDRAIKKEEEYDALLETYHKSYEYTMDLYSKNLALEEEMKVLLDSRQSPLATDVAELRAAILEAELAKERKHSDEQMQVINNLRDCLWDRNADALALEDENRNLKESLKKTQESRQRHKEGENYFTLETWDLREWQDEAIGAFNLAAQSLYAHAWKTNDVPFISKTLNPLIELFVVKDDN